MLTETAGERDKYGGEKVKYSEGRKNDCNSCCGSR